MKIHHHAITHIGRVRQGNEDRYLAQNPPAFFAVADGMGGHAAGEVAAEIAISELQRQIPLWSEVDLRDPQLFFKLAFQRTFLRADAAIRASMEKHPERKGMGTTLTALRVWSDPRAARQHYAMVGHTGDSRCYLVRGNEGVQVTTDHLGERGSLTNCLGVSWNAYKGVDLYVYKVRPGDMLVLATDGLNYGCPTADEVGKLRGSLPADRFAKALVLSALDGGGHDNVTVIVVELTE